MIASPDSSIPDWCRHWVSAVVLSEIRSCTPIRSNEINQVFRLDYSDRSLVLKIGPNLQREYQRLQWLEGRLPCPISVAFTTNGEADAFLMFAIEGQDLAELSALWSPQMVVKRLAEALQAFHATSITDWPFGGTGSVLVHGDACLPNFLYNNGQLCAYIDLGDLAIREPETDLAAAVWSLQRNLGLGYGLEFLHTYGWQNATEVDVERLWLKYQYGS